MTRRHIVFFFMTDFLLILRNRLLMFRNLTQNPRDIWQRSFLTALEKDAVIASMEK